MTGFINLYKEKGLTSFQNIKKLSRLLGNVKVGHTGTLDPLAEGVLPVCVGEATKLSSYVMAEDKDYVAGIILGYRTDSYDITGKVLEKGVGRVPTIEEIKNVIDKMIGITELDIPAFSAVNINGERAYKLAREGVIDSAGIRVSRIYKMDLMDYDYPNLKIAVSVEKGTYVRSIVNKIGVMLGTFAVMSSLVRVRSGDFDIKNALKLDDIKCLVDRNNYSFILPVNEVLKWSRVIVKEGYEYLVRNGVSLKKFNYKFIPDETTDMVFITSVSGEILAIASKQTSAIPFKNIRVFKNEAFKMG